MPTIGALAARVLWGYSDQQTAPPLRLVLKLAAQLKRAGVQDRTVQPRLLRHLLRGRLAHVLNLQVLDYDNDVVFADVVRGLVYEIFPDVGDFGVQLGDTCFRLTPPLRELLSLRQTPFPFRQFRREILERLALFYNFTVGQGC